MCAHIYIINICIFIGGPVAKEIRKHEYPPAAEEEKAFYASMRFIVFSKMGRQDVADRPLRRILLRSECVVIVCCIMLQRVVVCGSVLQYTAACCSVLQRACTNLRIAHCGACSECVVIVCCSVMQCDAVCCSMLQCVAVCCSVLQRACTNLRIARCTAIYSAASAS